MSEINSKIIGIGSFVPEFTLTNEMLEQIVDTSDEWIVKRTGVKERRIALGKSVWEIALDAAQKALKNANRKAEDLDLILVSTVTPDSYTPTVSCRVQGALGAKKAAAFDIGAACSGFVYAADIADTYIKSGKYKTILIISAEILSRITDYTDRGTCVLFGDGAGAAVMEACEEGDGILSTFLAADGAQGDVLYAQAFPTESDPLHGNRDFDQNSRFLKMQGAPVVRFTARAVPLAIDTVMQRAGIDSTEIDWVVPHQANLRILDVISKRYHLPMEKIYVNLDRFGNTSSASIPLCLAEMQQNGKLKKGQLIVLTGFGGGLTYGAILMRV